MNSRTNATTMSGVWIGKRVMLLLLVALLYWYAMGYWVLTKQQRQPHQKWLPKMHGHHQIGNRYFSGLAFTLFAAAHVQDSTCQQHNVQQYARRVLSSLVVSILIVGAAFICCTQLPAYISVNRGHQFRLDTIEALNREQERLLPEESADEEEYRQRLSRPIEASPPELRPATQSRNLVMIQTHKITDRFWRQLLSARQQLQTSQHKFSLLVIYWALNATVEERNIQQLRRTLGKENMLVVDNNMVAEFSPSFFGSYIGPLRVDATDSANLPWYFCQLPLLAAVHKQITSRFDYTWYLEYDVSWVGDLAGVLAEVDFRLPTADYVASGCECAGCSANGFGGAWQGCHVRSPGYIRHKDVCGCRAQVSRFSDRLLRVLYTHWLEGRRAYCEVAPVTVCSLLDWCRTARMPSELMDQNNKHIDKDTWATYQDEWAKGRKPGGRARADVPGRLYHKLKWR